MPKIHKKHQVTWTTLIEPETDDIDEWDDLEALSSVERIRKQPRIQSDLPDLYNTRRQRQRESGRDFQRVKKERRRNGDGRPS